jgi:hypothetical protein
MNKVIAALIITLFAGMVNAGIILPDETTTQGLPLAIPCTDRQHPYSRVEYMACDWYLAPRKVEIWNNSQNKYIVYNNLVSGECINGTCKTSSGTFGNWGRDTRFVLALWYYIGESSDGGPVAYLINTGPAFNGQSVTYLEAAQILERTYKDAGLPQGEIEKLIAVRYNGGWAKYENDTHRQAVMTNPDIDKDKVTEAFCSQDLDDSCTVNGKPVRKADLVKYFPIVDMVEVQADGGYCEYPLCYDGDDKPIGITQP